MMPTRKAQGDSRELLTAPIGVVPLAEIRAKQQHITKEIEIKSEGLQSIVNTRVRVIPRSVHSPEIIKSPRNSKEMKRGDQL